MPHEFQQTVASLDTVPEPFRALYAPSEGGAFAMAPEVYAHLDVSGLKKTVTSTRNERDTLKKSVQPVLGMLRTELGLSEEEEITPETLAPRIQALKDQIGKGANKETFDKWKVEMEAAKQKELAQKDSEVVAMRKSLESHIVTTSAMQALAAHDGSAKLLLPHVISNVRMTSDGGKWSAVVVDSEGDPRINSKGEPMTINELVAEMKADPVFAPGFKPSGNTGSGLPPGATKGTQKREAAGNLTGLDKIRLGLSGTK